MSMDFLVSRRGGGAMTLFQDWRKIVTPKNKRSKTKCIKATAWSTLGTTNRFTSMKKKNRDAMDGYCFGSMETQNEWGGEIPNFRAGESVVTWGCCLAKGGHTPLRVSWPCQKSHRLFLQAQTSFLCQQSLKNWVTHKLVLVLGLFLPFTLL
jgi:hypothetical protein